jgi:nucleoside-diphosphate-sugar epimerase
MPAQQATVVVTGIAGNLGLRLLPQLTEFRVIGVDCRLPETILPIQFQQIDLAQEDSWRELYELFRQTQPVAVIHLAFVLDAVRAGVLDVDRMWHINVAGTARVMEAITEANRDQTIIQRFIIPSSVAAYGPELPQPVTEEAPLNGHTLPYAIHKAECDKVVHQRAASLRGCSAYMLRPHIFAGATMDNYMIGAFRGTPNGTSRRAERMRQEGKRFPCMMPFGQRYLDNRIQFVHVDDVARLIAFLVRKREPESQRLTVLNVAGRGEALTFGRCIQMADAKLVRVPGKGAMRLVLKYLWKRKLSAIPPEALPYMTSEYIMNTDRLKSFLGADYEKVIQYTIEDAYADSFVKASHEKPVGVA